MRVSEFFNLNRTQPYLDFVDIPLNTDIPVFLDPNAIKSLESAWGNELSSLLQTFFEVVREFNFEVRHSPMPPDGTLRIP